MNSLILGSSKFYVIYVIGYAAQKSHFLGQKWPKNYPPSLILDFLFFLASRFEEFVERICNQFQIILNIFFKLPNWLFGIEDKNLNYRINELLNYFFLSYQIVLLFFHREKSYRLGNEQFKRIEKVGNLELKYCPIKVVTSPN